MIKEEKIAVLMVNCLKNNTAFYVMDGNTLTK